MTTHARKPIRSSKITSSEQQQYLELLTFQRFLYEHYDALSSREIAQISIYVDKRFLVRSPRAA